MSPTTGTLTAQGLRSDQVLPFLLIWYGWLSKQQGEVAKKRRLIVLKRKPREDATRQVANLTKRGSRMAKIWLGDELGKDAGYVYATYLREYGKIGDEPYYVYGHPPLGGITGFDWYYDKLGSSAG